MFPIFGTIQCIKTHKTFLTSEDNLRAVLGKMGVDSRALGDVLDKVRNRHYQVIILVSLSSLGTLSFFFTFIFV